MKNTIQATWLLLLLLICGCGGNETPRPEIVDPADSLNAEAAGRLQRFSVAAADSALLREALEDLDRALTLNPDHYVLYANKAHVLLKLNRPEEAARFLEQAVQKQPAYAEGMALIGFISDGLGDSLQARQWYEKARALHETRIEEGVSPETNEASRAFLLVFTQGKPEALQALGEARARYPNASVLVQTEQVIRELDRAVFLDKVVRGTR